MPVRGAPIPIPIPFMTLGAGGAIEQEIAARRDDDEREAGRGSGTVCEVTRAHMPAPGLAAQPRPFSSLIPFFSVRINAYGGHLARSSSPDRPIRSE